MSLGLRFCTSRRVGMGQGEVGGIQPWAQVTWLLLGLAVYRKPGVMVMPWWAISLLLCMTGLRKRSFGHVGPPFLAVRLFSRSVGATIGQEPWLLQAC